MPAPKSNPFVFTRQNESPEGSTPHPLKFPGTFIHSVSVPKVGMNGGGFYSPSFLTGLPQFFSTVHGYRGTGQFVHLSQPHPPTPPQHSQDLLLLEFNQAEKGVRVALSVRVGMLTFD